MTIATVHNNTVVSTTLVSASDYQLANSQLQMAIIVNNAKQLANTITIPPVKTGLYK